MVRVYSKTACAQCTLTKTLMGALKVDFREVDITTPENLAYVKSLGYMSAPVIVTDDTHWAGFQPDKIKALAERMKEK